MEQQGKKGLAIAGLILGIASLCTAWFGYGALAGIACGIIGIILSVLAKKSYTAIGQKSGMATAGLILSIIGLVLSIIMFIACVICATVAGTAANEIANDPELQKQISSALNEVSSSMN